MPKLLPDLPTPAELRALLFLNLHGPATVKEYREEGGLRKEGRAYTTVMSLMTVLHEKGLATRVPEGRAYRYAATAPLSQLRSEALNWVLEHAFGGKLEELEASVAGMRRMAKRRK